MRMGLRGFRKLREAAWFGLLALCIQAYIPVHLANDIAHAVEDVLAADAWLLDAPAAAAVAAHDDGEPSHSGGHSHPSHRDCALFLAAPGASAFVLPVLLELRQPAVATTAVAIAFTEAVRATPCPASYASRAPPLAV
jgi:hypothetical protein